MKKVIIIGCPGSGKTTLAKALGEKTGLDVVHLDKLQWKGNWETVRGEEFDARLVREMEKDSWIIDGNYNRTIPLRLKYCDTVIFLDFPMWLSLWGAFSRMIKNYGRVRDDMGSNCRERFDLSFFLFIIGFNSKNRKRYYEMLRLEKDKRVIVLKSRKEISDFLCSFDLQSSNCECKNM